MSYESDRPTKEKKRLFEFMEKNKRRGVVDLNKTKHYLKNKNYSAEYDHIAGENSYLIRNKRGTPLASMMVSKKRPKIKNWSIF